MHWSELGIEACMVTLKCACGLQSMVTCICCNGSKRMELLGTVMSSPVLRKVGTIMFWNGLERMAALNHKLDQTLLCTGAWAGHQ
jgi:hypothetical protein